MTNKLTLKQERFAQKYIELGNASEAYRQSYDAENMAMETINSEASRLLANPQIAARVEELEMLALKRHQVTVDLVVAEYRKLATLDIRKAFDEEGRLKPIHEIDDDTAAALAAIEVEDMWEGRGEDRERVGTLHKVKFVDKKGALDSIARHLGMFTEKVEVTGKNGERLEPTVIYLPSNGREQKPQ
jgi:phage terminase small subunit